MVDKNASEPELSPIFAHLLPPRYHKLEPVHQHLNQRQTASSISTSRLCFTSEELRSEGGIDFFAIDVTVAIVRGRIASLLESMREFVGGHVYPLMRRSELKMGGICMASTL